MFCGASPGRGPAYVELAAAVGAGLAARGLGLVYGGGRVGLMGAVADAALAAGGEVIGVIPRRLVDRELAHPGLSQLHVVGSLHERKAKMAELAEGFIAAHPRRLIATDDDLDALLARFAALTPPPDRWRALPPP